MKKQKILTMITIGLLVLLTSCSNSNNITNANSGETIISEEIIKYYEDSSKTEENTSKTYENGEKIILENESISITKAGTYELTGEISDGQILVDVGEDNEVVLKMNSVNVSNSKGAALYIKSGKATIYLVENTENNFTDGEKYENQVDDEPNATIFAKEDLVIDGTGTLTIKGNFNDAINTKDDLTIENGILNIYAKDDGIRGKDSLTINNGTIKVEANGDALKTDNEEKGNLTINNGNFSLISKTSQAIKAYNTITINNGNIEILESNEGLEAEKIIINNGDLKVKSTDDGINVSSDSQSSDVKLTINGGNIVVDASGDGLDSNGSIEMNGGKVFVFGPTSPGNGALDYDNNFTLNGGELIAFGAGGMEQNVSTTSTQNSVIIGLNGEANSKITIKNSSSETIFETTSAKKFSTFTVSTSKLKTGETYTYFLDGKESGTFTISSITTNVGAGNGGFRGGGQIGDFSQGNRGFPRQ